MATADKIKGQELATHNKMPKIKEYFTQKELSTLIGGDPDQWALIITKELIDNSLDEAEVMQEHPVVDIDIDTDGTLTIQDNGPGLPGYVVEGVLDYQGGRISNKNGKIAPTRGQLGNALKCLFGVPAVLNGSTYVEVESMGIHHDINIKFGISGIPEFQHVQSGIKIQNGCFFKVHKLFQSRLGEKDLDGETVDCIYEILDLVKLFAVINTHATFNFTNPFHPYIFNGPFKSNHWTHDKKAVLQWFDKSQFKEYMDLIHQSNGNIDLNNFLGLFRGLSRADKRKPIFESLELESSCIEPFMKEPKNMWNLQLAIIGQEATVKPKYMGFMTKSVSQFACKLWGQGEAVHRNKKGVTKNNRPFSVDVLYEQTENDQLILDICLNNSVLIDCHAQDIRGMLWKYEIVWSSSISILIHIRTPFINFTTKGKNQFPVDENIMVEIESIIKTVSMPWVKQVKAQDRKDAIAEQRAIDAENVKDEKPKDVTPSVLPMPSDIMGMKAFADKLIKIQASLTSKKGTRGWCYILEDPDMGIGLSKNDFNTAQNRISECRKMGLLPFYFIATDENRKALCGDHDKDDRTPTAFCDSVLNSISSKYLSYHPVNLHDFIDYSLVVAVEKIDLVELFKPVCERFHIPLYNAKGWSDLNSRGHTLEHFKAMHDKGKKCILLYCGDYDIGGLKISNKFKKNLMDLKDAFDFDPSFVTVERFGLNPEFIEKANLSWIMNLDTKYKNPDTKKAIPLDNPSHPQHNTKDVQWWLKNVGVRKCEANSLVVREEAGQKLLEDTILKYIKPEQIDGYEQALNLEQAKVREIIQQRFAA